MKTYWKLTVGTSALMLLLLATPFPPEWTAIGIASVLLSGYAGVKLAPHAQVLRESLLPYAIGAILLGGVLQGVGMFSHMSPLWGLGLVLALSFPLAGVAHDFKSRDIIRQRIKLHAY